MTDQPKPDASPESWRATAHRMADQLAAARAEVERLKALADFKILRCSELATELARMRPVVEAAVAWADTPNREHGHALSMAIVTYRKDAK